MSNYLLLRDNKQSGPYSVDELRSKGLKPYDLVWVDGKSAAWRYPSEMEELKSFAPVVEEQPFDRFFKKPSQVSSSSGVAGKDPIVIKENLTSPVASQVATQPEPEAAASAATTMPGRRIIYVTMPGNINKTAALVREPGLSETMKTQTQAGQESVSSPSRNSRDERVRDEIVPDKRFPDERTLDERAATFSGLQIPHQGTIEEDFSQEAAVGNHRFVEKRPQYGRSVSDRMLRPLGITLSVIALLAAGVFIGLSINGHFRGFDHSSTTREELATDRTQDRSTLPMPVYATAANDPMQKTESRENPSNSVISDPVVQSTHAKTGGEGVPKKKTASSKERLAATQLQKATNDAAASAKDSALALLAQPNRQAIHRADQSSDKEAVKNSVIAQVSVSSNKYNTGTFGGISELQLTVSNRSIYPLDLVVVEVQYIQANKKVYKTENLYFRGIGAGATLMEEAPKSSRGVKIQYRIILINSKELGLSYSGI